MQAPKRDFDPVGQGQAHGGMPSPFTVTGQVKLTLAISTLTSLPLRAANKRTVKPANPYQPPTGLSTHQTYSTREMLERTIG